MNTEQQEVIADHIAAAEKAIEGNPEGAIAHALLAISYGVRELLLEMDQTKCGHGTTQLFTPCPYCALQNQ